MIHHIEDAARILRKAERIVVFTGAGVSAESGIPTFRDDGGFWREFPPEQFATSSGLVRIALRRPRKLAEFLTSVLAPIAFAWPNAAHLAIARLERTKRVTVISQNIDQLHQEAGSQRVLEIHGSLFEIRGGRGSNRRTIDRGQLARIVERLKRVDRSWAPLASTLLAVRPLLGIGWRGVYRPNVVLFNERMPEPNWSNALDAARQCDALISIGTSGMVLPAAIIPSEARSRGVPVVEISTEPAEFESDICLRGTATELLPVLVDLVVGAA